MEQKAFLKLCTSVFKQYDFEKKNNNYYRRFDNDIMLVFGLQKSAYGGNYYYLEYGFVFQSINKYMPYPKYHQANIRQDRMSIDGNYAIECDAISEDIFVHNLSHILDEVIEVCTKGKKAIVDYSIFGEKRATLIQGYDTLPYLNLEKVNITVVPD